MRNIKNFSYNFIKYLAMGLAFTLISFLFRSCEVNAQGFFPTYNGIELANSKGDAIHWISAGSISYGGRSGIEFYTYKRSNDVNTYAYRWNVSQNFKLDLGKGIFSGYAFYQSHTETGQDIYGVDGVSLVSTIGERIPCTIENSDQITKYSCSVSSGFILDYIEINSSYYADPYGVVGISSMFIDNDPSQAIIDSNNQIKDGIDRGNSIQQDTNDTIKSDDVDTSSGNSFFNTFQNNGHGLTGVINAPLSFIQSLSNSSCSPVSVTIPFVNETFKLPCFSSFYKENFNAVYTIYQVVITALVGYWVCVKIYAMVKGFKDPTDDRIEVMDL